jgi:perosamine synthetase
MNTDVSVSNPAAAELIQTLKRTLPVGTAGTIPLHEPEFKGREQDYVRDCVASGWVSSLGDYIVQFEKMVADACGVKYAVATVNGTAALHIALLLAGVKPDDEVFAPALTFIATINAISYCGAVPHFVDSELDTLGMDIRKLDAYLETIAERRGGATFNRLTGRRIGALLPMHTFGHPVDLDAIVALSTRWNIPLVEDAAESLGSRYKGRSLGGFGMVSAISFNGNKIVTTGGGGCVLTNDEAIARRAKHITTTAKYKHDWAFVHDEIGYNYRLPNLNAALGCAQMERLESFLSRKRALALKYEAAFQNSNAFRFVREPEGTSSNYWLNSILLAPELADSRDDILESVNAAGFGVRPVWTLIPKLKMYEGSPKMDLACANDIERRLINIPSSPALMPDE